MSEPIKAAVVIFGTMLLMVVSLLLADAHMTKQRTACIVQVSQNHNVSESKDLCN
jgi:hypothetical protein